MPQVAFHPDSAVTLEVAPVRQASAFEAKRFDGAKAILDRLTTIEQGAAKAFAFQRYDWLAPLYQCLAVDLDAVPVAVEVCDAVTGELALFLPMVKTQSRGRTVASFASLGVSDYGAPVIGTAAPTTAQGCHVLANTLKRALDDVDIIDLSNMPLQINGRVNPLTSLSTAMPSRHARHALSVETTVEALLASRGKKYRKESERCFRLLAEKGAPSFKRAETDIEIARAYAVLEAQQHSRRADEGDAYVLDRPSYSRFYLDALVEGAPRGTAHIFTLKAGDEIGAVLFGISHGEVFTLLRISTAQDDAWKRMSPGRLIVIETMRYFVERGVRTFDMGIGSYSFKHGFGIAGEPLSDLMLAVSVRAVPRVGVSLAKSKLRQYPRLVGLGKRLLGRD